jgi:hypothetical protein
MISSESIPMLGAIVPSFELFINRWELLAEKIPRCEPFIRSGLECTNEYYGRLHKTDSYLIAMRM